MRTGASDPAARSREAGELLALNSCILTQDNPVSNSGERQLWVPRLDPPPRLALTLHIRCHSGDGDALDLKIPPYHHAAPAGFSFLGISIRWFPLERSRKWSGNGLNGESKQELKDATQGLSLPPFANLGWQPAPGHPEPATASSRSANSLVNLTEMLEALASSR